MTVSLNSPGYSYDVHSLIKAFFPGEDVKIVPAETEGETPGLVDVHVSSGDIKGGEEVSGFVRVTLNAEGAAYSEEEEYSLLTRAQVKSLLKRKLYAVMLHMTGRDLPWGTMTGIRPVKVPMKLLREGRSDGQIAEYMRKTYLCSEEKISLAVSIAHREQKVIERLHKGGFALYIGIPFCPTTCMYCSFTSYPIAVWNERTDEYLSTLKKELAFFADHYRGVPVDSIYIGGGTPTTLTPGQLGDLCGCVMNSFDTSSLLEFTVEAGRPDSITGEKLSVLKEAGCDRISINPQTMNEKTLAVIGRSHTVGDVYRAYETARKTGFSNINMDLILGLPGEDEADVAFTFDRIKELAPDSLTVHSMAVKRAANMHKFLEEHKEIVSRNTAGMMETAAETASSLGLLPYYLYRQKNMAGNFENVGYARKDCFGIYNIAIMEEVYDIAAAGAGTISKRVFENDRIERCDNVKDVALYIDRIDEMIDKKKKLFCEGE